jgi:hypothetical protein
MEKADVVKALWVRYQVMGNRLRVLMPMAETGTRQDVLMARECWKLWEETYSMLRHMEETVEGHGKRCPVRKEGGSRFWELRLYRADGKADVERRLQKFVESLDDSVESLDR